MLVRPISEARLVQHISEERRSRVDGENPRTTEYFCRVVSRPGIVGATTQIVSVEPFVTVVRGNLMPRIEVVVDLDVDLFAIGIGLVPFANSNAALS